LTQKVVDHISYRQLKTCDVGEHFFLFHFGVIKVDLVQKRSQVKKLKSFRDKFVDAEPLLDLRATDNLLKEITGAQLPL
jgi:hypothetical protein